MSIVPVIPDVVSIEEIDDYFNARGAWNGRRFELASTPHSNFSAAGIVSTG